MRPELSGHTSVKLSKELFEVQFRISESIPCDPGSRLCTESWTWRIWQLKRPGSDTWAILNILSHLEPFWASLNPASIAVKEQVAQRATLWLYLEWGPRALAKCPHVSSPAWASMSNTSFGSPSWIRAALICKLSLLWFCSARLDADAEISHESLKARRQLWIWKNHSTHLHPQSYTRQDKQGKGQVLLALLQHVATPSCILDKTLRQPWCFTMTSCILCLSRRSTASAIPEFQSTGSGLHFIMAASKACGLSPTFWLWISVSELIRDMSKVSWGTSTMSVASF